MLTAITLSLLELAEHLSVRKFKDIPDSTSKFWVACLYLSTIVLALGQDVAIIRFLNK